jgi:hypothetical protein
MDPYNHRKNGRSLDQLEMPPPNPGAILLDDVAGGVTRAMLVLACSANAVVVQAPDRFEQLIDTRSGDSGLRMPANTWNKRARSAGHGRRGRD